MMKKGDTRPYRNVSWHLQLDQGENYVDFDMHVVPVRLAARLFDPDAFVFSAAMLKTHNVTAKETTSRDLQT
jgi:hypothetical protein